MPNELRWQQGGEPIDTDVENVSSYGEAERPESGMLFQVSLWPVFHTGHSRSLTLTLFVPTSIVSASDDDLALPSSAVLEPPRFEVSFSHGLPPGELSAASSSRMSGVGFHEEMAFLHSSVLHEQHLFHSQIHHPVQAARMWYSNLLGRVHSTNQNVRTMVARAQACVILATLLVCFSVGSLIGDYRSAASAHYVVCELEAYLIWTLFQLENATAPSLAILLERERRLRVILHSLTSIQLSAEGIHIQSSRILRSLVIAIDCDAGPSRSPLWTTRMNRMLLNYEERGLDLASQISHLVGIVITTMQMWNL